jgi:hypothetical protein
MAEERTVDLSEFEKDMRLSQASSLRSRDRENLVEHVFISEILQECWFVREQPIEILRSEVDAYGYDVVIECNSIIRHVQLKATDSWTRPRKQTVNRLLEKKAGGCVVWVVVQRELDAGRITLTYRYFGGKRPQDRMPSLGETPATNPRSKTLRPNLRLLDFRQFDPIPTTAALLDRMFGKAKPLTCNSK